MQVSSSFACCGAAVALAAAMSLAAQPVAPAYAAYQKALADHGLTAVLPASTDFAPGYVYKLLRNASGKVFISTVCSNLFLSPSREIDIGLPDSQQFSDNNWSAGLNFLPGILPDLIKAKLGVEASRVRTLDMRFLGMQSYEVAEANQFDATTRKVVQRQVNPACQATLAQQKLSPDGSYATHVFIVLRATKSDGFSYTLKTSGGAGANVTAGMAAQLDANVGWKLTRTGNQTFKIERAEGRPPIYLAADVVQLVSSTRTSNVTGGDADLTIKPARAADLAHLAQ